MRYFLCAAFLFFTISLFPQQPEKKFPEAYFGSYKGDLLIKGAQIERTISMEFHMKATDSIGKYQYQLVYIVDGKRQERNYNLITKDALKGEYTIDENNGIILSARQFDNRLYSFFEVQGSLIFTLEEFYDNYMIFEVIASNKKEKVESVGAEEDNPEVFAYPVTVSQRAKLIKQ